MKKRLTTLLLAMALAATALVGCATKAETPTSSKTETAPAASTTPKADIKHTQKVGDITEEITIPGDIKKVAVFDYGVLDMLDTLGLGDKVVGVSKAILPEYLSKYKTATAVADIGSLFEANYETLAATNPDLIIISGRQASMYAELKKIAPTLYVEMPSKNYIVTLKENAQLIGEIFNKTEAAQKQLDKITSVISEVKAKVPADKKALVVLSNNKALAVYGPGSRYGIIHDDLGIKPINEKIEAEAKAHGDSVSYEFIAKQDADYLFVIDRSAAINTEGAESAKTTLENSLIKDTKAYKENNIVYLDSVVWYLVSGGFQSTEKMVNEVKAGVLK
jgi:iron complex transport system substrate-binding protein